MARTRSHTRRHPRSNPRGVLSVRQGGFGFVQTAEGEYFVPEAKMNGAFHGDLVEIAPLPGSSRGGQRGVRSPEGRRGGSGCFDEKPAARVVRVVDRAHDTIVGRYEVAEPFGVVVPEDARIPYDIFTMRADHPQVPDGALVRARITTFPSRATAATGVIEEVLSLTDDEGAAIELIIARHKLETTFSEGTQAEAMAATLDVEGALAEGYRDLRDRFVFTIDPSDARDFDDALSLDRVEAGDWTADSFGAGGSSVGEAPLPSMPEASGTEEAGKAEAADCGVDERPKGALAHEGALPRSSRPTSSASGVSGTFPAGRGIGSGVLNAGAGKAVWRLGVHIADVSHYVPWNSSVDLDARRRATSVYLVDRVIPMLPEQLSNELCSLKPGEDRRSLTADLYLDERGRLVRYELYPALIRSDVRLSYDQAQEMIDATRRDGGDDLAEPGESHFPREKTDALGWRLSALSKIAGLRARARRAAGGIDFATTEAKVRLDGEGRPLSIELRRKTEATSLVEEAMILANETVASHLRDAKFPCIYRVHEQPSAESLAALVPVFQEFAWFKDIDQRGLVAGDPLAVQAVLAASAGRAEGELVSTLVLRSLKRAVYRPLCEPHYGLASAAYTHFTSPIRRYPDLVVHRMLRSQLTKRPEWFDQEVSSLAWLSEHSSAMECVAEAASRESHELKIIEYLERFIGQTFSAVVSGVASYGLFVRLENTAEGLVHMKDLGHEYFALDPVLYRLTGQDTGKVYHLGQRLSVVLVRADMHAHRLDFRLADTE